MATITYLRPHFDKPETVTNRDAGPIAQDIAKTGGKHNLAGLDIEVTMTDLDLVKCVVMHETRYANA